MFLLLLIATIRVVAVAGLEPAPSTQEVLPE